MSLLDQISAGGTQAPNPLMQFLQGKQFKQQNELNQQRLAASKQAVQLARKKEERAQQQHEIKTVAPIIQSIEGLDTPEAQQTAFDQAKVFLGQQNIDVSQVPQTYKEFKDTGQADAILNAAGIKPPKGKRRNILIPGVEGIQPGIENEKGQILSPTTGKRIPGATIAPSRQETGEPGSLTRSQLGKEKLTFDERSEGIRNSSQAVDGIIGLVSSDDFIGGTAGFVTSKANSFIQQVSQITGRASIINAKTGEIDETVFTEKFSKENRSRFRRAAQQNDLVDSAVLELAFVFARELNPDGKISDADVRQAEKILLQSADKESQVKTLRAVQNRMLRRFNNFAKVKGREGLTLEEITDRKASTEPPTPTLEKSTQVGRFTIEFIE